MTLHASEWAAQQWATVELGDRRLTRRAVEMGTQMAAHPEASLPEQMGAPSVLKAAYGLLNHPGVSLAALTAPHRQQTLQAAGALALVLQVEDTTELDFTHHPSKTGLAPIGNGGGRGLLLHSTLAISAMSHFRTARGAALPSQSRAARAGPVDQMLHDQNCGLLRRQLRQRQRGAEQFAHIADRQQR